MRREPNGASRHELVRTGDRIMRGCEGGAKGEDAEEPGILVRGGFLPLFISAKELRAALKKLRGEHA